MEKNITINSDGIELSGVLHRPEGKATGGLQPAIVGLHGFGGSKTDGSMMAVSKQLCEWGYIFLRVDSRGCGESGGPRGHVIPDEQVADARNVFTWLAEQDGVDPNKIILLGDSLGAAVSLKAGSTDSRVAGVVACGGWGNGQEKVKIQHPEPDAWGKYLAMLEKGREHREKTGESLMVQRFDIVPIPEHMRSGLPDDAIMQFPVETAQSIFDFMPNDFIAQLAPRPLLLLHASTDAVTPTDGTLEVFRHAGMPKDLALLSGIDHFPLASGDIRIYSVLKDWLDAYLPLPA